MAKDKFIDEMSTEITELSELRKYSQAQEKALIDIVGR